MRSVEKLGEDFTLQDSTSTAGISIQQGEPFGGIFWGIAIGFEILLLGSWNVVQG